MPIGACVNRICICRGSIGLLVLVLSISISPAGDYWSSIGRELEERPGSTNSDEFTSAISTTLVGRLILLESDCRMVFRTLERSFGRKQVVENSTKKVAVCSI